MSEYKFANLYRFEFNRQDKGSGHKFNVPEHLLKEFDDLFERCLNAKRFSEEYYDLITEFMNKFDRYMVDITNC